MKQRKTRTRSSKSKAPMPPASSVSPPPPSPRPIEVGDEDQITASKFDLGPDVDREAGKPLPWGYDEDVVRALTIDPERLFVYWEITDRGIAAARERLPPGEAGDARICLRIYDVSGRIFDGTNAHHWMDIPLEREQRQWFVHLDSPGSEQCAEVGLLSRSGTFARIARSRKAALPRRQPWPMATDAWMTVRRTSHGASEVQRHGPPSDLHLRLATGTPPTEAAATTEGTESDVEREQSTGGLPAERAFPGSSEQSRQINQGPSRGSGQG